MPAKVLKIRDDFPTDPKTLLGMLLGDVDKIQKISAVVIWDNDEYQFVCNAMHHNQMAMSAVVFQEEARKKIYSLDRD